MGYDANTKQIRKTTTYKPPDGTPPQKARKLVEQAAFEFEQKYKGLTDYNENMTFGALCSWFFQTVAPNTLRQRTIDVYTYTLDAYVLPVLGSVKLKEIYPARLNTFFAELHTHGALRETYILRKDCKLSEWIGSLNSAFPKIGISISALRDILLYKVALRRTCEKIATYYGKSLNSMFELVETSMPLAVSTVQKIITEISAVFSAAVKSGILKENPVKRTTTPKDTSSGETREFLDEEQSREFLTLLDAQPDGSIKTALFTALFVGLRSGELLGLHWSDVDLDGGVLFIRHSVYKSSTDGYFLTQPKNSTSVRALKLPTAVLEMLKRHRLWQSEERENLGTAWSENDIIFPNETGGYLNGQFLNIQLKKITKGHGFPPGLHLHSLRHSCASLLINQGVNATTVAQQLGHASANIMQSIYAHSFQSAQAYAAQALETLLIKNAPPDTGGAKI
jgi:integrase